MSKFKTFFCDLERYSHNTAILTGKSLTSYKEFLNVADMIGCQIEHRCLVLVACKNSFASLAGYVGFMRVDVVPLLTNYSIDILLLSKLIAAYQPEYLFLPSEKVKFFRNCETIFSFEDYVLLKRVCTSKYSLHESLSLILSTSGSTGSPKYVRQTCRNINSNTESIAKFLNITQTDRAITTMPMSYTYGLSIIHTHLFKGASIILTDDSLVNKSFWKILKEKNATTFGGVPYIFEILKKLRFNKLELPSLKYITQAGGKLERELCKEFASDCAKKGIKFYVMYGQVEATARISYLPCEHVLQKPDSIGVPILGGKIWLEDENSKVVDEVSLVGELVYQGVNVSLGYAENCFDLHKGDENHGILYTGDLAKFDKEGYYYIVGRKKRFLKMFGNRVNLDEIEQLIRYEGIDCACTGIDDTLNIYITKPEEVYHIKKYISKKTGIHSVGFNMIVVDQIPRNESGKVLYSDLESQYNN